MAFELIKYILKHTVRSECTCGPCVVPDKEVSLPSQQQANLVFFNVAIEGNPTPDVLISLIDSHITEHRTLNIWDGAEHTFYEVGRFIGDQALALRFMALGFLLNMWDLHTPYTLAGSDLPHEHALRMAASGAVAIQTRPHAFPKASEASEAGASGSSGSNCELQESLRMLLLLLPPK